MNSETSNIDYKSWLLELKTKIQKSQIKASLAINRELIQLYWELGQQIAEKQEKAKWGSGFIEQLSKDLKAEFPDIGGFSVSNLKYCKQFYIFYGSIQIRQQVVGEFETSDNQELTKTQQAASQFTDELFNIPWGHHIAIIQKIKNTQEAIFYIQKTIENNWSRSVLLHQIESNLYQRQGKAINNFTTTLPQPQSDLTNQLLKDPYQFDFLQLTEKYNERDLEKALTHQITEFLLELGAGFSFVGKQYPVYLGEKEYFIDLLFYHLKLRCFIVIELKVVEFQPEFAGKLNFYLNIIDDQLKHQNDQPSIGVIICKTKDNLEAEYALRGIEKPIGISEYDLKKILPEKLKGSLPTIEEIEAELNKI